MIELRTFVPEELQEANLDIRENLAEVVENLRQILPPEKIWELFSSTPGQTGGRIMFPYARIDSAVICARDNIWMINYFKDSLTADEISDIYLRGSDQAFKALAWVEVGFQGLQNLAISEASRNWTAAVGHFVTDEERAERIMTAGKQLYDECLGSFARYRKENNMRKDYFEEYNVEYLLDPFLDYRGE